MLSDVIDVLADPVDGTALHGADGYTRLVSESGHSYDVARQGYVTLAGGQGLKHDGDSIEMINSREAFLSRGLFSPFVEAVSHAVEQALDDAEVPVAARPAILEVGAGTGYYLAHTLDLIEGSRGIGLDVSVPAAKHLSKAHPRIGAVVSDVWAGVPALDKSIDAIVVAFAPRNFEEFARVLTEKGQTVVLTADTGHLKELREPLGIIDVERGKLERMLDKAEPHMRVIGEPELIEYPMTLDREAIFAQVGMSPSARHIDPAELRQRMAALPQTLTVTARAHLTRLGVA